ncbi:MAG: 5'-3' exonuclease [Lentisphaeria bacterium]|nr:5'-3' exonuclease [Lentisphaeria bacterium]
MKKKLLLVDAFSQVFRGYFAVRALSTASGVPTNAVFAMTKLLLKLQQEYGDCDGAFVFDKGKCSARLELAPAYKANRPPMPEDLRAQMEPIRNMIRAFGWPIVESEGFEADDLIGAAAVSENEREVLILSSDKDLSQLINDRVKMLVPDRDGKGLLIRDIAATQEKFGVPPEGIVDYLSLIGDSSDNIPGVDGVGPKTAASLISQFGSVEAMLAAPEKIAKENLRNKIVSARETLELNRKLILLNFAAPLDGVSFTKNDPDYGKIRELAEQSELRSILKELDKYQPAPEPVREKNQPDQLEFNF